MTQKKDKARGSATSSRREHKGSVVIDLLNKITSKASNRKKETSRQRSDQNKRRSAAGSTSPDSVGRSGSADKPNERRNTTVIRRTPVPLSEDSGSRTNRTPNAKSSERTAHDGSDESRLMLDGNADLDHPRYDRGLSSPDLRQNRSDRAARKWQNRSSSLELLRRSHECLKTGGTCQCKILLYRPASSMALGQKTDDKNKRVIRSGHGSPATATTTTTTTTTTTRNSLRGRATVSDLDVSSFFKPSPTIWEPKSAGSHQPLIPKHGESRKSSSSVSDAESGHEHNGYASDAFPGSRTATDGKLTDKVSRSSVADLGRDSKSSLQISRSGGARNRSVMLTSQSCSNVGCAPQDERATRFERAPAKPRRLAPENRTSPPVSGVVTNNTTIGRQIRHTSPSGSLHGGQPIGSFVHRSTSGPDYPASTTYFRPKTPGLPTGRDVKSYGYKNEEEKTKVLSLLDRYSSKTNNSLLLSGKQMADYLSYTKRQLGLDNDKDTTADRNRAVRLTASPSEPRRHGSRRRAEYPDEDRTPSMVGFDKKEKNRRRGEWSAPQTTFHVDGAITGPAAIRQRPGLAYVGKPNVITNDDVNNNDDVTAHPANGRPLRRGSSTDGHVISRFAIPSRHLWRKKREQTLAIESGLSEIWRHRRLPDEQYQQTFQQIQNGIRYSQSLDTLRSWIYGSSLMIVFVLFALLVFAATFGINHVIQTSALISYSVAVILVISAAIILERRVKKTKEKLRVALMRANSVLCDYDMLCAVIGKQSCKQGTTLYFLYFDIWPCQESLMSMILEKTPEDFVLTEISRKYANLFEITKQHLKDVNAEPDIVGKEVISKDLLMYFAAAFIEDFLFGKKSSSEVRHLQEGEQLHDKQCLCHFIKDKALCGTFANDIKSPTDLTRRSKAGTRKPTLL